MDVGKCRVPLWHGGTLNNRRAASPLVRLVEGEERWEAPDHTPRVFSLKIGLEPSQNVLSPECCLILWLTTDVHSALCRDEFRGPLSDIVRQTHCLNNLVYVGLVC
ncbi:uncharacterized protein TNCV_2927561 [Trichonephila clavipes]|nr:uncharacterized protein TNCV_2927561 [Trichonephila clavipes]